VLSFHLGGPAAVTLAIYDSAGRHVKTLLQEHLIAGDHAATWNGADDSGLKVSTGVYFARLDAGGDSMSRKLIMLK
jgi:flagellar hook assembly protein FlgD